MSKITAAASGLVCIRCGRGNGEVCARHANGSFQYQLGKGAGIKAHDLASAELCDACNSLIMTEGNYPEWEYLQLSFDQLLRESIRLRRDYEQLLAVTKTNIRRFDSGVLKA